MAALTTLTKIKEIAKNDAGIQALTDSSLEVVSVLEDVDLWVTELTYGSYTEQAQRYLAARIEEYAALGLDKFILSGYPHLEEAYRFAELVFPLLSRKAKTQLAGGSLSGPFGEVVANLDAPSRLVSQS